MVAFAAYPRLFMATKYSRRVYDNRLWQCVRRVVLQRDKYRCTKCARAGRLEVHHIRSLREGGAPFDPANCKALCRDCHFDAHRGDVRGPVARDRQEWIDLIGAA